MVYSFIHFLDFLYYGIYVGETLHPYPNNNVSRIKDGLKSDCIDKHRAGFATVRGAYYAGSLQLIHYFSGTIVAYRIAPLK